MAKGKMQFKPNSTNVNKGYFTHGSFKPASGQKLGVKKPIGKEKLGNLRPVDAKLRKISKAFLGRQAALNQATMRAQLNG